MRKVLIAIICFILMLSLIGATPSEYYYYQAILTDYESQKPLHDYAGIFSDEDNSFMSELGEVDGVELCVYTYTYKENYHSTYSELKERGVEYVALFINVDTDGKHIKSNVYYHSYSGVIPSAETLESYYNSVSSLMESGNYSEAISGFFSKVSSAIVQAVPNDRQEYEDSEDEPDVVEKVKRFNYFLPYFGIAAAAIAGIIVGGILLDKRSKRKDR